MPPREMSPWIRVCLVMAGLYTFNGCASFDPVGHLPFLGDDQQPAASDVFCVVELRGRSGQAKKIQVPVTPETRVVQVLEEAKATRAFRRMDAYILRRAPEKPHEMVKLEIRFDRETRKVKWETDYAIHPDDRVIVSESTVTVFEEAYNAVLGPILGNLGR